MLVRCFYRFKKNLNLNEKVNIGSGTCAGVFRFVDAMQTKC